MCGQKSLREGKWLIEAVKSQRTVRKAYHDKTHDGVLQIPPATNKRNTNKRGFDTRYPTQLIRRMACFREHCLLLFPNAGNTSHCQEKTRAWHPFIPGKSCATRIEGLPPPSPAHPCNRAVSLTSICKRQERKSPHRDKHPITKLSLLCKLASCKYLQTLFSEPRLIYSPVF